MARTTRENYFMIAVAAAVGLWAVDRYAWTPYTDAQTAVAAEREAVQRELDDFEILTRRHQKMRRVWSEMRAAGVESSPSEAERKMLHALRAWAQDAGIAHLSLRPERVNKEHGFVQVVVHATGSGNTAAVAKFLWSIESATTIPVRVDDVHLTPAKEGADELQMNLSASTLCATRETQKPGAGRPTVALAGEGRP